MYNATLERISNSLLYPLGGYEGIYPYKTDAELADICLFNGATWFASPYQVTVDSQTLPYYLVDLLNLNYQPNSKYSILDSQYRHQFSEVLTPITYKGNTRYFWGLSSKATNLLSNAEHASRWFMLFHTPTGPVLSQFFVTKNLSKEATAAYNAQIREAWELTPQTTHNEVNIYFAWKTTGTLRVYSCEANYNNVSDLNTLKNYPSVISVDYESASVSAYLQPKTNTWLGLELIDGDTTHSIHFTDIQGLDSWQHKIIEDNLGNQILYIGAGPTNRSAPMNRLIGGLGTPITTNFLSQRLIINAFTELASTL